MPPEAIEAGAAAHFRALESLYRHAPVNRRFESTIEIGEGFARIRFEVREELFHAAGAAHGTLYFKMMDDAAFYACNSLVTDRFADHRLQLLSHAVRAVLLSRRAWSTAAAAFSSRCAVIAPRGLAATGRDLMRSHSPSTFRYRSAAHERARLAASVVVASPRKPR